MNFSFDGYEGMVLVFSDGYLSDSNEAAQRRFNSYGFSLLGKPMKMFVAENELKRIEKESTDGGEIPVELTLFDGSKAEFTVTRIKDSENEEYIVLKESSEPAEKWLAEAKRVYDPMLMGKAEIYKQELSRRAEFAFDRLKVLENSALIRKDSELYSALKTIKKTIKLMEYHDGRAISEFADTGGGFVTEMCSFSIGRLVELLSEKARGFLMLESYNISLSFSALKNYGVYGDYMKIGRAVSMFLVASIKYVIASGRKGRINVSVRQSGKRVRIMIADNGIGLSGKVFERIHSDGVVPSGLDCFKELSGVGISDAVRWIEESGGEVYITNDESKGSATEIFLPLCKESYLREEHLLPDIESAVASIFSVLTENEPE